MLDPVIARSGGARLAGIGVANKYSCWDCLPYEVNLAVPDSSLENATSVFVLELSWP